MTSGRLDFGTWERIFYGEFDDRRRKRVLLRIIGEYGDLLSSRVSTAIVPPSGNSVLPANHVDRALHTSHSQ